MLVECKGNILDANADALVNPVNTVGVMGKGLALAFKNVYPDMFKAYDSACRMGLVVPGQMHVYRYRDGRPRYIINFPTKRHWRDSSQYLDIVHGMKDLVRVVTEENIRSIAIPALGCGCGGLQWGRVYPLIQEAFSSRPGVEVLIYPPR